MTALSTLRAARPATAAFAAMGVVWGTFAAVLPDLKTMLGVDERGLGLLMLFTPIAAVLAMLMAPAAGVALGRVALPAAAVAMALAFAIPGQVDIVWLFPLAMMLCGAATGLTDVLMNARVAALENERNLHLMNLCHAAYSFGYAGGALGHRRDAQRRLVAGLGHGHDGAGRAGLALWRRWSGTARSTVCASPRTARMDIWA